MMDWIIEHTVVGTFLDSRVGRIIGRLTGCFHAPKYNHPIEVRDANCGLKYALAMGNYNLDGEFPAAAYGPKNTGDYGRFYHADIGGQHHAVFVGE